MFSTRKFPFVVWSASNGRDQRNPSGRTSRRVFFASKGSRGSRSRRYSSRPNSSTRWSFRPIASRNSLTFAPSSAAFTSIGSTFRTPQAPGARSAASANTQVRASVTTNETTSAWAVPNAAAAASGPAGSPWARRWRSAGCLS